MLWQRQERLLSNEDAPTSIAPGQSISLKAARRCTDCTGFERIAARAKKARNQLFLDGVPPHEAGTKGERPEEILKAEQECAVLRPGRLLAARTATEGRSDLFGL